MTVDLTQDEEVVRLAGIISEHQALIDENPDGLYPAYADALMNLAARLADLGKPNEALAAALDGVEHFSALVDADAEHFRIHLASACNNLSNRLAENGHDDDARTAGEQSIALARSSVTTHPDQGRFVLISALMNQASRLRQAGEIVGALEAMREATTTFRKGGEPLKPFLGVMVESLHRAGLGLAESGLWDEAVTVRRLTGDCFGESVPAPVHHLLALSLEQAAHALSAAGRHADAIAMIEEGVAIARKLVTDAPGDYELFLAQTLGGLASRLHESGNNMDAMQAAAESIGHFQKVSESDAAAAVLPLSVTMETFATILIALGHSEQAESVLAQRDGLVKLIEDAQAQAADHGHDHGHGCGCGA
jgi:Tetratricopeptide repeat